ncbi:MAG: hypothetical protein J5721_01530 [Lachnospiraceae bacterium]|nr:hypothetical protein [Lachnospiraceae bacterium]
MKKQEKTIGLIMAVIMSVAMGILASIVIYNDPKTQTPPLPIFCLINIVESVIVGVIVAIFVPLGKLGMALAKKAKAAPPSLKFNLINSIPLAVGNSVIVSAVVSFIGVATAYAKIPADQAPPLLAMWFSSWGPLLIPSIVISYLLAILVAPIVVKAVRKNRN